MTVSRSITVESLAYSKPQRGSAAAINGRPWTPVIGPYGGRRSVWWDEYQTQNQPLKSYPAAVNGFIPVIVQVGGGHQTRYVHLDQLVISKAQRGSIAAITGTGTVSGITADVMVGMDTFGWPEQETSWWSPPQRGFPAAINNFPVYSFATDTVRAQQAKFWQQYQEQQQPLKSYPAAVQAFPVYSFSTDMVRAKRSQWTDEYQQQLQILKSYAAAINGTQGPIVAPIYQFGPRYIVLLPPRPFLISAISMQTFNVKDPAESVLLTFNMAPDMLSNEILVGTPSVNVTVVQGTDPNPNSILNGVAGFDVTTTQIIVPVTGGVSGTFYEVQVTCQTNNFLKKLSLAGVLPVRSIL